MHSRLCAPLVLALLVPPAAQGDRPGKFDPLPHRITSFGACDSDGWIYAYGGHTGARHSYSSATTTGRFFRAPLAGGRWEELPAGLPVQGTALVAHGGKIYRVGGMQPRNPRGEPADTASQASCASYDPATRKWQPMPDLPAPRSSHEAVIVGDRLIVVGGWQMQGAGQAAVWHRTALSLDLARKGSTWQTIDQPFQRRALGAAVLHGKVHVAGGLTAKDGAARRVDVLDPASGKWSTSADLPEGKGLGFSPAACTVEGQLYLSTNDGRIHRLNADRKGWTLVARQAVPRHVHRLVAGPAGSLVVLGGSGEKGDPRTVEVIVPGKGGAASN